MITVAVWPLRVCCSTGNPEPGDCHGLLLAVVSKTSIRAPLVPPLPPITYTLVPTSTAVCWQRDWFMLLLVAVDVPVAGS